MKNRCRTIALFLLCALSAPAFATPAFADNHAIGRLNYAGYNQKGHCTASLISSHSVLTAAHCVQDRPPKDIHILLGYARGEWVEHHRVKSVHLHDTRDIAIACLATPSDVLPIKIDKTSDPKTFGSGMTIGYPRSRPHLAETKMCSMQSGDHRARFDCPLEPGMSGAPILVAQQIIGVVSGTTQTYSVIELVTDLPMPDCDQ